MNQRRIERRIVSQHHQANPLLLRMFPSISMLILVLLSLIHLPIPLMTLTNPAFAVMGIFYLTLWQPRHVPLLAVFFCGLVYDAFQSTLFGTHALLFLLLRLSVARLRQNVGFIEPFFLNWCYFILCALTYLLIEWAVASVQLGSFMPDSSLIERDVLTLASYPLISLALSSLIARIQSYGF
jgi:rod shape-determining protein MreD